VKITFRPRGLSGRLVQVDDSPLLQSTSDGVRLRATSRNGEYEVELTLDDCLRIAEAIDYEPVRYAGHPPP
jgi:hypothetical protein